jgi:hypothetical protein
MQRILGRGRIPVIGRILAISFIEEPIAELAIVATVLAVPGLTIAGLTITCLAIPGLSTVVTVERSPLNGRSRLAVRDPDDPDGTVVLAVSGSRAGQGSHEGRSYPV